MNSKAGFKSRQFGYRLPICLPGCAVLGGQCDLASVWGRGKYSVHSDELEGMKLVQSHRRRWLGLGHLAPD